MLDKRLTLGGLQVGGPRTAQNPARFRVANNVYQTRDGVYVPRFGNETYLTFGVDEVLVAASGYKDKPFAITRSPDGTLNFYYDSTTKLPCPDSIPKLTITGTQSLSNGITFVENIGCLFFNIPELGVYKFDGVAVYRTGVPLPYLLFLAAGTADPNGCYVRTIAYRIDPEGNIVVGGYTQTRGVNKTGTSGVFGVFSVQFGGNSAVYTTPTTREIYDDFTLGANDFYALGTIVSATGADDINFTATEHNLKVGCRVFLAAKRFFAPDILELTYLSFKVSSVSGNDIVLSASSATAYNAALGGWQTPNTDPAADYVAQYGGEPTVLSDTLMSVWSSDQTTGVYAWKNDTMALPYNKGSAFGMFYVSWEALGVTSPSTLWTESPFSGVVLGDVYDVTTVKSPFPCQTTDFNSNSMGVYDGNLYVGQKNQVYHSDTSVGGSFEMTNGLASIVVGSLVDGDNVAVCGTDDFLVVSRKTRTYVLQGNIPTANYNVRTVKTGPTGAYSSESVIRLDDAVVLINKIGAWVIRGGGNVDEQSEPIRDMFDNFSDTFPFEEEGFWNVNSYPMFIDAEADQFLRATHDRARDIVVFYENSGKCLLLNASNGEFTTWSDLTTDKLQTLTFILDKYYAGAGNKLYIEDKTSINKFNYAETSPVRLSPTWLTAGEPSLEKKTLQLKMWGLIEADVTIYQQRDWNETKLASDTYAGAAGKFSHKKRIESANTLAVSVTMEFKNISRMELEGLEIEFHPFQMGMKR